MIMENLILPKPAQALALVAGGGTMGADVAIVLARAGCRAIVLEPGATRRAALDTYFGDTLRKLGLEHNPTMRFIIQLSWGGGDIDNQDFPKGAFDNIDKEQTPDQLKGLNERNIKAGETQTDELNEKYGKGKKIVALVPSAQAMVAIRTKIANKEWPGLTKQGELFVDAVHPSAPMESLNTYMHFVVLYGRSPVGLPMPTMLKNAKREAWDEKFNRSLQELAWETVTKYPYSLVTAPKAK